MRTGEKNHFSRTLYLCLDAGSCAGLSTDVRPPRDAAPLAEAMYVGCIETVAIHYLETVVFHVDPKDAPDRWPVILPGRFAVPPFGLDVVEVHAPGALKGTWAPPFERRIVVIAGSKLELCRSVASLSAGTEQADHILSRRQQLRTTQGTRLCGTRS